MLDQPDGLIVEQALTKIENIVSSTARLTGLLPVIAVKRKELSNCITELEHLLPEIEREGFILHRLTLAQKMLFCRLVRMSLERGGYVDIKSLSKRGDDRWQSEYDRAKNAKLLSGRDAKGKRWGRGSPLIQKVVVMSAEVVGYRTYACYKPIGLLATLWKVFYLARDLTQLMANGYDSLTNTNKEFLHLYQVLDTLKQIETAEREKLIRSTNPASIASAKVFNRISTAIPSSDVDLLKRSCEEIEEILIYAEGASKRLAQSFDSLLAMELEMIITKITTDPQETRQRIETVLDAFNSINRLYRLFLFLSYSDRYASKRMARTSGQLKR